MNRLVLILFAVLLSNCESVSAAPFKQALPGYKYSFPADHKSHDQFKTEWWYFTGHLTSKSKKDYGFELTFFRSASDKEQSQKSVWSMDNLYLAHFALTDIENNKFYYFEKLNRKGLGVAGASREVVNVFNERWSMELLGDTFVLRADEKDFALSLALKSKKKPVVHGIDGVSQKASGKGRASHYYSLTRLVGAGQLTVSGKNETVEAVAWMDHEFGSNQLQEDQVGWDWFSLQLDSGKEVMLYLMRKSGGSLDKHCSGTLVLEDGSSRHLTKNDFRIKPTSYWLSPISKGKYPMGWIIEIPSAKVKLRLSPIMKEQELNTSKSTGVTYWEGAVRVDGSEGESKSTGRGYVEMTGYAERFRKKI